MREIIERIMGFIKINRKFLGFSVLALVFVILVLFLFVALRIYFDIYGLLKIFIAGIIFVLVSFKYLLPNFSEIKQEKRKWVGRVMSSLGGLFMSFLFVYFAFFQIKSQLGGLFSLALALFLAFYSFEYLSYNQTEKETETSLNKLIINRLLNNRGQIVIGMFITLFLYVTFLIIIEPTPEQTQAQVAKIHNTKITMADVLGTNLPPRPSDPDVTVQGYDVNNNGIRDDVELDIWEMYPNSQKTRAVLLQYALTQQMEVTQQIVNKETVTAVAIEDSRAYSCVSNIFTFKGLSDEKREETAKIRDALQEFIQKRQNNTETREETVRDFYQGNLSSYTLPDGQCDIDLSKLPN